MKKFHANPFGPPMMGPQMHKSPFSIVSISVAKVKAGLTLHTLLLTALQLILLHILPKSPRTLFKHMPNYDGLPLRFPLISTRLGMQLLMDDFYPSTFSILYLMKSLPQLCIAFPRNYVMMVHSSFGPYATTYTITISPLQRIFMIKSELPR